MVLELLVSPTRWSAIALTLGFQAQQKRNKPEWRALAQGREYREIANQVLRPVNKPLYWRRFPRQGWALMKVYREHQSKGQSFDATLRSSTRTAALSTVKNTEVGAGEGDFEDDER